jgi:exonuclease SbcC
MPDAEEERLAAVVKAAEQAVQQAQAHVQQAKQQLERQKTLIISHETALAERTEPLQLQEAAFVRRLHESSFADEQTWLAARLAEQERKALRQQADALRRREEELQTRRKDRQKQLAAEEQSQPAADQEPEQLRQAQRELHEWHTETIKQIGSVQERLKVNGQRRGEQTELLGKLAAQSREYLRWRQLDELIGSADGKKYRNFAQGLTFEQMVVQANRQLTRMTDRYRLVRDQGQPLELNVTDRWQADEVRSAKNLSGGESFVVSLALALGLSGMAGGKVESLFLDEGFGTLDDAALETALESLAELRREGRLIGVISHVAALKERIACRIEVRPKAGGRSLISGPGVRRLEG